MSTFRHIPYIISFMKLRMSVSKMGQEMFPPVHITAYSDILHTGLYSSLGTSTPPRLSAVRPKCPHTKLFFAKVAHNSAIFL